MIQPDRNLYFPSVDRFREALRSAIESAEKSNSTILIDLSLLTQIDYTSLKVTSFVARLLKSIQHWVFFSSFQQMLQSTSNVLKQRGLKYSFVNATRTVEKSLMSVLPAYVMGHWRSSSIAEEASPPEDAHCDLLEPNRTVLEGVLTS